MTLYACAGAQYCDQVSGEASGEALESLVTPQDAIAELSQLLRGRDASTPASNEAMENSVGF